MHFLKHKVATFVSSFHPATPGAHILMYHAVGEVVSDDPNGNFTISHLDFKKQIEQLFQSQIKVKSLANYTPSREKTLVLTFDDGYLDNLKIAMPILQHYQFPFTVFISTDAVKNSKKEYLTSTDLKELATYAHIGTHGKSHRSLVTLNPNELQMELADSKKYLEDLLGKEILTMSYPHGGVNAQVKEVVQQAGYKMALSSVWGNNTEQTDLLELRRIQIISKDTLHTFKQKVSGKWDWL